jgi:hypothetical protein
MPLLALGASNAMNLGRYFGGQQPESRTWAEMSSPVPEVDRRLALIDGVRRYPAW